MARYPTSRAERIELDIARLKNAEFLAKQAPTRGHLGSTPDGGIDDHDEPGCPACHGSGEGEAMEGRGPDTYTVTVICPECDGHGVAKS